MIILTFDEEKFREILSEALEKVRDILVGNENQKYLTPKQLSELVGWKVSTVYQNHHNGIIPGAKKVENRLLFDSEIIHAWIAEKAVPTKNEKIEEIRKQLGK